MMSELELIEFYSYAVPNTRLCLWTKLQGENSCKKLLFSIKT